VALNDRLGTRLGTFCALTPLDDAANARAAIAAFGTGAQSPFARLAATHFARFVVLASLERQTADQPADVLEAPYLVFSAFFDGERAAYLTALCDAMPDEAHAVWRHCRDYPGHPGGGGAAFRAWLERHRVPATQNFGAYADATVAEVRDAVAFRQAFRAFAFDREGHRDGQAAFAAFDAGASRFAAPEGAK
jgi:hypothetical protein